MSRYIDPLRQASNLSNVTWDAIRQHPAEYKVVHDFAVRKLSVLLSAKKRVRKQEAVSAALIEAGSAILKSSKCRAAIKKISNAAAKGGPSAPHARAKPKQKWVIEVGIGAAEVGIGGAAVLVMGAFVAGFIIGTYLAKL